MKRATVLFLALLLVPAAKADAKFSSARVCGLSDCREIDVTEAIVATTFARGAASTAKPPEASPWYRVTLCGLRCDSPDAFTLRVLPTTGYEYAWRGWGMRRRGWAKLNEDVAAVSRRVTTDLEPFPAARLIPLGAEPPDPAGEEGIPAWVWIAIAAGAATLALPSLRSLWQQSPSLR